MYGLVVLLLSLKLSSDLYPVTGLAVVAQVCTCQFVTCRVCECAHFVRCIGGPATDHDNLDLHSG